MNDELNLYRAVQAAREDISTGIDEHTAIQGAARRYSVSAGAVDAHVRIARRLCREPEGTHGIPRGSGERAPAAGRGFPTDAGNSQMNVVNVVSAHVAHMRPHTLFFSTDPGGDLFATRADTTNTTKQAGQQERRR